MPSSFELFKEQLDDAIGLIEGADVVEQTELNLPTTANELVDTQSLIARCESVCNIHQPKKPVIRIIHHLACSGDRLISKCISAMPNVYLLSEVHPYTDFAIGKDKSNYAPSDIASLARDAGIPKQRELARKLFKQSIDSVYRHLANQGGDLVLLEDIKVSILKEELIHKQSELIKLLEQDYDISSILIIRNPADTYHDIFKEQDSKSGFPSFSEYCLRYKKYLDHYPKDRVFSEENVIQEPQAYLKSICELLQLTFNSMFEDIVNPIAITKREEINSLVYSKGLPNNTALELENLNKSLYQFGIDLISSKLAQSQIPGVQLTLDAPLNINACVKKQRRLVIVLAGMRHCGSTALFNILRLLIQKAGFSLFSCYSEREEFSELKKVNFEVVLIKTHELRTDIREFANVVITSVRDLRDAVASSKRRGFPMLERVGGVVEYANYNRTLHDDWAPVSNYEFNYEKFMQSPLESIVEIQSILGLPSDFAEEVCNEVMSLPTDKYETTLLSPSHITDPERKESYKTTLTDEECKLIEEQHGEWLAEYGYLV